MRSRPHDAQRQGHLRCRRRRASEVPGRRAFELRVAARCSWFWTIVPRRRAEAAETTGHLGLADSENEEAFPRWRGSDRYHRGCRRTLLFSF